MAPPTPRSPKAGVAPVTDASEEPERYVRMLAEEAVAGRVPLATVVAATAAVAGSGGMGGDVARRLQTDVALAVALRTGEPPAGTDGGAHPAREPGGAGAGTVAGDESPFVIAVGPATVALPGASLHVDAVMSDGEEARIEGRLVEASPAAVTATDPVAALVVTDDAGTTYRVSSDADPGAEGWSATLRPPPPARATRLSLAGTPDESPLRLVLARSPGGTRPAVAAERGPATHFLRTLTTTVVARYLLDGTAEQSADVAPAVDALVAVGLVTEDDPVVAQAVLAGDVVLGLDEGAGLDADLRAVLDARNRVGRRGVWPVLSPTVVADGVAVRVDALIGGPTALTIAGPCHPWPLPLDAPLLMSATDDLGGRYVGTARRGPVPAWGLVPGLDPGATELTLVVTGPHQEATWVVELA